MTAAVNTLDHPEDFVPMSRPDVEDALGPPAEIDGICHYTCERSQRGYVLTRFLVSMRDPENRRAFELDPEGYMAQSGLNDIERELVNERNYDGMLDYGASIYALERRVVRWGRRSLKLAPRVDNKPLKIFSSAWLPKKD